MSPECFLKVFSDDCHRQFELFVKDLFTIIINSEFVIDVPLMKEVAVFEVGAVVLLQEVRAVFGGSI